MGKPCFFSIAGKYEALSGLVAIKKDYQQENLQEINYEGLEPPIGD
jgi:hypothetical protein